MNSRQLAIRFGTGPQPGFSLIELLIVVLVMSLTAVILLPALHRGRDQSQTVICNSNLRSLYAAANLYATDHQEFFPDALNPKAPFPYYTSWASYVWHYLSSGDPVASYSLLDRERTFGTREIRNGGDVSEQGRNRTRSITYNEIFCPATFGPYDSSNNFGPCASDGLWMDYGVNGLVVGAPNWVDELPKKRRTEIVAPQRTILFADATYDGFAFFNPSYYRISGRHDQRTKANVVLIDGHVESARWQRSFADIPEQDISFNQSAWTGTGYSVYVVP